jgi:hypothetical protein
LNPYSPGDHILLREIWEGAVWSVRPVVVVRDEPDVIALYMPPGTPWKRPRTPDDRQKRIPRGDWILGDDTWFNHVLRITPRGEPFSVLPIWRDNWSFRGWYINIEEPLRPSPLGFDYMDCTLDVILPPGMRDPEWKDTHEIEEAVRLGVYTPEQASRFEEIGHLAIARLQGREPPFDEPWEDWRPDPAWGIPARPEKWE